MQKQEIVIKNPKDNIVAVALRVFGKLGVYKTTMNDIAIAAKKGRRTIYQYFRSKEEIYQAVLEKETANMVVPMKAVANSDAEPVKKLKDYALQRITSIYKIAENHNAFKIGFIHNDKVILKLRKRFDRFDSELLKKIVNEGAEKGIFKSDNTDLITKNIQIGLRGMEIDFIKNNMCDECKYQLDLFIDMITQGILK